MKKKIRTPQTDRDKKLSDISLIEKEVEDKFLSTKLVDLKKQIRVYKIKDIIEGKQ